MIIKIALLLFTIPSGLINIISRFSIFRLTIRIRVIIFRYETITFKRILKINFQARKFTESLISLKPTIRTWFTNREIA